MPRRAPGYLSPSPKLPTIGSGFLKAPTTSSSGKGFDALSELQKMGKADETMRKDDPTIQKNTDENMERDMVYKSVYGHSLPDLNGVLKSSTTGYQDPGARKFAKNPMTFSTIQDMIKQKNKPPSSSDEKTAEANKRATEDAYQYASTFKPGQEVNGQPLDWPSVQRNLTSLPRFKGADFNDPRFKQLESQFNAAPAKSGFDFGGWIKKVAGNAMDKLSGSPAVPDASLPSPQGHAEGSFLKQNGVRTHVLKGGQWSSL